MLLYHEAPGLGYDNATPKAQPTPGAEMSNEPVTVYPVSMDKTSAMAGNLTDFRPKPIPAEAEEEDRPDPKVSSAQAPADSSESPQQTEPEQQEMPVLHPAGKANTLAKVPSPGKPAS